MTGPCIVKMRKCGQIVTGVVKGRVYNLNSFNMKCSHTKDLYIPLSACDNKGMNPVFIAFTDLILLITLCAQL